MKYSLLSVSTESNMLNIGDYIQALASSQFLPTVDGFIERERLNLYKGETTKIIMNGWFMHHPENWPPSELIDPLFVAFHINLLAKDKLISDKSISYLKRHEPIGCRDKYTLNLLIDKGVNAYYSGCMTLTLGQKFHSEKKTKDVYFVDSTIRKNFSVSEVFHIVLTYLKHCSIINKIYVNNKNFEGSVYTNSQGLKKLFCNVKKRINVVRFYRTHSPYFKEEILENAKFVRQQSSSYLYKYHSNEDLLACAEHLVKNYAQASLVVTSRIHCALPCLGLGTPVLYVYEQKQSQASICRMDGIIDLFNTINVENGDVTKDNKIFSMGKIGYDNIPQNKSTWKNIAESLRKKVEDFIS